MDLNDISEQRAGIERLREALHRLDRVYDSYARDNGLSPTAFWSLYAITKGHSSQAKVAQDIAASRQTVNSAFKLLVSLGLIELVPDPHNGRVKHGRLTPEGASTAERVFGSMESCEERAWNGLPPAERASMIDVLERFIDGIGSEL